MSLKKKLVMKMFSLKFSSAIILHFFVLIISLITINASEATTTPPNYLSHSCESSNTTFTSNSSYAFNVKDLLSSLSYFSHVNDFYYANAGHRQPEVVFGLFLCRGDVTNLTYQDCVANASKEIQRLCPNEKKAIIWYEECLLRYSDQPIFAMSDTNPVKHFHGADTTVTDNAQLELFLGSMVNTLAVKAANLPEQSKKFGSIKQNFTLSEDVCGLAQCTPDLSPAGCSTCFRSAIEEIPVCCNGQRSARLLLPSCFIMYDSCIFFNKMALETPPPPPPPPPPGTIDSLGVSFFWQKD